MSDACQPDGCGLFSYGDDLLKNVGKTTAQNDHVWAASIAGADAYIRKLFKTFLRDACQPDGRGLFSYGDDLLKNVGKTTAQE